MRKALFSLVLSALIYIPISAATDWHAVVQKAERAVLYIESEDGACSGSVINVEKKYVMTAAHCYSSEIYADLVVAKVIALDTKKDLMVLEVKDLDPSRPALKLADKNPDIMQEVMSVGFGYALERPQFRAAQVSDNAMVISEGGIGGPLVSVNVAFTPGQSGGPVLDAEGNIVSIVQRGDGGTLGIGVPVETIRARIGRFFSSK